MTSTKLPSACRDRKNPCRSRMPHSAAIAGEQGIDQPTCPGSTDPNPIRLPSTHQRAEFFSVKCVAASSHTVRPRTSPTYLADEGREYLCYACVGIVGTQRRNLTYHIDSYLHFLHAVTAVRTPPFPALIPLSRDALFRRTRSIVKCR